MKYKRGLSRQFEQVDDFEDNSRPPMLDEVEWLLKRIFVVAGPVMLAYGILLAIATYMNW